MFGPYLTSAYGEKVRAYLRRGAEPLPGFAQYPNSQVGYGTLCEGESSGVSLVCLLVNHHFIYYICDE